MKMPNFLRNALTSRQAWLRKLLDGSIRDIEKECGHPTTITSDDYHTMFLRGDVASRVVALYPEESWSEDPIIFEVEDEEETEWEKAVTVLLQTIPLFSYLQRADTLSGIGRYGILLLGIDDGLTLDQPIATINKRGEFDATAEKAERKLIYLRPMEEKYVRISQVEADATNPRFGQPVMYEIDFAQTEEGIPIGDGSKAVSTASKKAHWTRVIHLADNRTNSEVYGLPRMEKVYNRLLDLKKIAGGSGEMFWKGGFPGIALQGGVGEDGEVVFDKESAKEQMEAYMEGLQRYLAVVGMEAKSLTVQVADPLPHYQLQMNLIALAMGVPVRILIGSERGELASTQDMKTWNRRINKRRQGYLSPFVIRPVLDRLMAAGVLPPVKETGYQIDWEDLNGPSDAEKADVADKRSAAMQKYVSSGADQLMPPFFYFTLVLGMDDDEAQAVLDAANEQLDEENRLIDDGTGDDTEDDPAATDEPTDAPPE